jgi:predicted GIY-YIG superfamily endonuclease
MENHTHSRDEIVALLFSAAMSGNIEAFAHERGITIATLRQWKLQYISDYVRYLEAVLFRIKDQIDY